MTGAGLEDQVVAALLFDFVVAAEIGGPAELPGRRERRREALEIELRDEEAVHVRQPGDQLSRLAVLPADGEGERAVGVELLDAPRRGREHDDVADLAEDTGIDAERRE